MMETSNRSPSTKSTPSVGIEYLNYRVAVDGLPTGLFIKAETRQEARRQLAISASRLGFTTDLSEVELTVME